MGRDSTDDSLLKVLLSSTVGLMHCFELWHCPELPLSSKLPLSSGLLQNCSEHPRNEQVGGLAAISLASAEGIEP